MKTKYLYLAGIIIWVAIPQYTNAQKKESELQTSKKDSILADGCERCYAMMQRMKEMRENKKIQEVFTFTGKITDWHYNEDFIYDGFYLLQKEQDTILVRFDKTLGEKIRSIENDVTVRATIIKDSSGNTRFLNLVNIQGKGETVYCNGTYNHIYMSTDSEDFRKGKGRIKEFRYGKDGETITGFILDNNVALLIDSKMLRQIPESVEISKTIEYTGIATKHKKGQIKAKDYIVIHCQTITIDGKQYLVL